MAAQDDRREHEMRTAFNLAKPDGWARGGIDAVLTLNSSSVPKEFRGREISLELKSTTGKNPSISTVRDLGLHHIEKWRELHWIFGIYGRDNHGEQILQYCLYASPEQMRPWLDKTVAYTEADETLVALIPDLVTEAVLSNVLGDAESFDRATAKTLMKSQYGRDDYRRAVDLPGGRYSREAMLAMLRERCRYLMRRGATRNNPHISPGYFRGWERITENHAARLRELVVDALKAQAESTAAR